MSSNDQCNMGLGDSIRHHDHKHPPLRVRTLTLAVCRNSLETGGAIDDRVSACGTRRPRGGIGSALHRSMMYVVLLTLGVASTGHAQQEPFTMVIMNDPQISYWNNGTTPQGCSGDKDCASLFENMMTVRTIHQLQGKWSPPRVNHLETWPAYVGGGAVQVPVAVIINGDLTNNWGNTWPYDDYQKQVYRFFYERVVLKTTRVLFGLGNHDYTGSGVDHKQDAIRYMRESVGAGYALNFPGYWVTNFDHGSMSYSWDYGTYHFVQLHGGDLTGAVGVTSFSQWLQDDVARATAAEKKIVLNIHNYQHLQQWGTSWTNTNVVAIFKGHNHDLGKWSTAGSNRFNQSIPVFEGGHSGVGGVQSKLLVVEFGEDYMKVGTITFFGNIDPQGDNPAIASWHIPAEPKFCDSYCIVTGQPSAMQGGAGKC